MQGRPPASWTSTVTGGASMPTRARLLRMQRLKGMGGAGATSARRRRVSAPAPTPSPEPPGAPVWRGYGPERRFGHRIPPGSPGPAGTGRPPGPRADYGRYPGAGPGVPGAGCRPGAGSGRRDIWGPTWLSPGAGRAVAGIIAPWPRPDPDPPYAP